MERVCVYPGSFDPVTIGHADIIERAARLFDQVIVAVLHNPNKTGCFRVSERVDMLRTVTQGLENVTVDVWDGLLVDYVRRTGAVAVIRGLRGSADLEAEMTMAQINARLLPGMETVFLTAKPEHVCVSSSAVREAASFGAPIRGFVPESIESTILTRFDGA